MVLHLPALAALKPTLMYMSAFVGAQRLNEFFNQTARKQAASADLQQRIDARNFHEAMAKQAQRAEIEKDVLRQSRQIDADNWPLRIGSEVYANLVGTRIKHPPLVMIYLPPVTSSIDPNGEFAAKSGSGIRDFLNTNGYSALDPTRPVEFLPGRADGAREENALKMLYHYGQVVYGQNVPTALIQMDNLGRELSLLAGCFGFGQDGAFSSTVVTGSGPFAWSEHAAQAARAEMETLHAALATAPDNTFDISRLEESSLLNLALLNLEHASGQRLDPLFRPSPDHFRVAAEVVQPGLNLLAAGMADFFHWSNHGVAPRLPSLLPSIIKEFPGSMGEQLMQRIVMDYVSVYRRIAEAGGERAPMMLIDLADSLLLVPNLPDRNPIEAVVEQAIAAFRRQHSIGDSTDLIDVAKRKAFSGQQEFLTRLSQVWRAFGNEDAAHALEDAVANAGKVEATAQTPPPAPGEPWKQMIKTLSRKY